MRWATSHGPALLLAGSAAIAVAASADAQVPVAPTASPVASPAPSPPRSASPATSSPPLPAIPQPSALPSATATPSSRPFGPGFAVTISCDRPFSYAFLARGALDSRPSFPDPFVKIGHLPLTVELPSGVYTLIVEGHATTSGSTVFEVRNLPATIRVKGGSSALHELSTWMMAFGAAAVLAGGVLEMSGTSGGSAKQKNSIAIPLFIGGGVALVSGIGMLLVSGTTFQNDAFVPGRSGGPAARIERGLMISGQF